MTLQALPGSGLVHIGPLPAVSTLAPALNATSLALDAANEAAIFVGQVRTADGGSHTIDTTGSSSIGWRSGTVTFANAGTTLKVGIAAVDTAAGPPARAANSSDVIAFDVSADLTGGGGGVTSNAWLSSVPTTGTKTIANGDLVAVCMQMTARGGADIVRIAASVANATQHRPNVTQYLGGAYNAQTAMPIAVITFSDGTLGWLYGTNVASTLNTRTWNSGSATNEYGQLYQMPFPMRVLGIYGFVDALNDTEVVLYSDPLGTPVAEKTRSFDANTMATADGRRFYELFDSAYTVSANAPIGVVFKPGASNISAYYKTLADASHRVTDPWGTSGYGISRASGAFADTNSSLDHYYIGLLVDAFGDDAGGSGAHILGGTVVR